MKIAHLEAMLAGIASAGAAGAPSGPIYGALMTAGCSLDEYQKMVDFLVHHEFITKRGNLLFATKKTLEALPPAMRPQNEDNTTKS